MMASTRRKARAGRLTGPVSLTGPNRIGAEIGLALIWTGPKRTGPKGPNETGPNELAPNELAQ